MVVLEQVEPVHDPRPNPVNLVDFGVPVTLLRVVRLVRDIGKEIDDNRAADPVRSEPQGENLAPISKSTQPESDRIEQPVHGDDVGCRCEVPRFFRVERNLLEKEMMVVGHNGEAAEQHGQRIGHLDPVIGVQFIVVGLAVMHQMHVAERFVFMK